MNTSLVKSVPQGDFAEISALMRGWESQVETLVSQRKPIKYDMYPMLHIPQDMLNHLRQAGYHDLVLESDRWQHFLMPN
jgi:hypothetical protein